MKKAQVFQISLVALFLISLSFQTFGQDYNIQYFRPYDKYGVNMFETPKDNFVPFEGLKVRVGGNFTQQFQALDHENMAVDLDGDGEIDNPIQEITPGFNLATANLNIDVQLEDGIRLNMVTYLSSRHHPEAWVKAGFIQFDELPFLNSEAIDRLMDNVTIRIGHMEVNYGDQHFRRTDNGNAMYNPFVGNYIVDAFNTEIGGEIYYQKNGFLGMVGITGGEINGNVSPARTSEVDDSDAKAPSILGKLGYDKQINENTRLRLTGSLYYTASSAANHIFDGDRGGSRYYNVLSPPGARAGDDFRTGRYNPNFNDQVTALQFNAFLKAGGFEFFGTFENGSGRSRNEADSRSFTQIAAEALYRFGGNENFYLGARYNTVGSEDISGVDVTVDRIQVGLGWFVTKNMLMKAEYVTQSYTDFPEASIYNEASFNGVMVEATVGF